MKKVTFYCQHLLGIGHLTRSLNICEGLVQQFEVKFIQGGPDVKRSIASDRFQHIFLPPLVMDEASGQVQTLDSEPADDCWNRRSRKLSEIASDPGDALIVELFPFGRKAFYQEIAPFIEKCRLSNPELKVYSSVRDILVQKKDWEERQLKIIDIIDRYFDGIFVHSDENLVPFSLSFQKESLIHDKLIYTGFISENEKRENRSANRRDRHILVSIGGGIVGEELIESILETAELLPDCSFQLVESPNMNDRLKSRLSGCTSKNLEVIGFTKNFEDLLLQSDLSVSMAGYNTTMNLLSTRTFGLVYPYQKSTEQMMRTSILEKKEVIRQLKPHDLPAQKMAKAIVSHLNRSDWDHLKVNLDGSKLTTQQLLKSLS